MNRIVYFTGTGGTGLAAKTLVSEFAMRGAETDLHELRRGEIVPNGDEEMLTLLFPVHASNAPRPVYEWLNALAPVRGIPAVVVSVSAGGEVFPNLACRVRTIKMLERKGYRVVYEQNLMMPSNFIEAMPQGWAAELLRVLPRKAGAIADEVMAGLERHVKPPLADRLLSVLLMIEQIGAKRFGRGLRVTDACTGCGWCARECPMANIRMKDGRPEFLKQCALCTRCIYGCPTGEIRATLMKSAVLKEGFDLARYASTPPKEEKGELWAGLRRYFEDDGM